MRLVWWRWRLRPGPWSLPAGPASSKCLVSRSWGSVTWRRDQARRRTLCNKCNIIYLEPDPRTQCCNWRWSGESDWRTRWQERDIRARDRGRPPPPWSLLWHFANTLPNSPRMLTEKMVALMIVLLWNWTHIFAVTTFTSQKGDTILTLTFPWYFQ